MFVPATNSKSIRQRYNTEKEDEVSSGYIRRMREGLVSNVEESCTASDEPSDYTGADGGLFNTV